MNTGVNGGLSDNGPATGNTVTLAGGTVAGDVFGGVCNSGCDDVSGNTLAVEAKGSTVGGDVGSFEKLSFALPADIAAGETMLKVGGGAYFPATTTSVAISGSPALNGGESITLIDAAGTLEIT
ncbi:MAG: hypothetical protein J6T92_05360, partial [Ottowia sp.]|nr:hypothetical protein [Ottowia sp.]